MVRDFLPIFSTVVLAAVSAQGAIIATEVGNNAPGTDSDNEYVVILNTGATSVDLTGYDITDSGTGWDPIGSITVAAGQSVVISSGADQAALETAWGQTIPGAAQFVIITGLAAYNNTGTEAVQIRDGSDTTVYTFSFDTTLGDDSPATAVALGATGGSGGSSVTPFSTVSTVPEPSIAFLGCLGVLGLLRRHR